MKNYLKQGIIKRSSYQGAIRYRILMNALLFILLLVIFIIGLHVGQYRLTPMEVINTLIGRGTPEAYKVLIEIRLPRLVLACLVGLGMGVAGVVMQNLLHNDLASPGTLGVSDGSALFVTLYITLIKTKNDSPLYLPLLALVGGIISAVLIFALSYRKNRIISPTRVIMTGVAMSAVFGAIGTFSMFILDQNQLEFLQRWQSGELWGTEWEYILILFIWLLIFSSIIYYKSRTLNVINIGYDIARGLGVNVAREFVILAFCAVAISSGAVAFGGNFFFLGLIAPHIARKLVGEDLRVLLPASSIIAGVIVLVADMLVQGASIFANIPTGVIVSVVSVPYFIFLLLRKR